MAKKAKIKLLKEPVPAYDREKASHGVLRRTTFIMIICGIVLFIPLIYPLLYACVTATTAAITGTELWMDLFILPLVLACGYDIVMLLVCWVLYDFVVSA